jgi:hypothetical protein
MTVRGRRVVGRDTVYDVNGASPSTRAGRSTRLGGYLWPKRRQPARCQSDGDKWDGLRLLVAIDQHRRVRTRSRRGASPGDRLGWLLKPLAEARRGSVFDGELVPLVVAHAATTG